MTLDRLVIESPYLDSDEAIAYLKLPSVSALYRLIREYRLPYCRVGRLYRFDRREIDAWLRGTDAISLARAQRKQRVG